MKIEPNYGLSSDHTPVIATISTTLITVTKTPKCNWQEYRNELDDQIKLNISLKTPEELEEGKEKLTLILQEAARQATPPPNIQKTTKIIPFEIKKINNRKKENKEKVAS